SRRQTDGAVFHGLLNDRLHLILFFWSWSAIIQSHHLATNRAMRDQSREIHCKRFLLDLSQELTDISSGRTAVSSDQRCHSHADEILGFRKVVDGLNMCVYVDESRRNNLSFSVDYGSAFGAIDAADPDYLSIIDSNISAVPRIARTVDHPRVQDHHRIRLWALRRDD